MSAKYSSIEELAHACASQVGYYADGQPSLRPIGTKHWLLFSARVPNPIFSTHSYEAHRYYVTGYTLYGVGHDGISWIAGETIDNVREADGMGVARSFPVHTYKMDDRGLYTDYPAEWSALEQENRATWSNAIPGKRVAEIIARSLKEGDTP